SDDFDGRFQRAALFLDLASYGLNPRLADLGVVNLRQRPLGRRRFTDQPTSRYVSQLVCGADDRGDRRAQALGPRQTDVLRASEEIVSSDAGRERQSAGLHRSPEPSRFIGSDTGIPEE